MSSNKKNLQASTLFVFITLAIDSIGLGIILPVLPDVIRKFMNEETSVSQTYGYFIAVYAFLQFLSSPLLGRLSDLYGRRPILLISLLGAGIDYIFMAFAPTLPLLFVGRIISGISGASFTVVSAYIADISDDSNRAKNFGIIGAGFGLGFILGPAIGGLLGSRSLVYPFLAAAVFNLLNFLFGYFILPESLSVEKRRSFVLKDLNPFKSLMTLKQLPNLGGLVIAYILIQLASHTHFSIWTLYTESRFGWTSSQVGISLAVVGFLSAFSQGFLTGPLVKKFGDRSVMMFGCFGEVISYILFGFAYSGAMLYAILVFSCIFWSAHPAIQSLISKEIPDNEQGELQGALMSITNLMAIINPILMTSVFAATSLKGGAFYFPGSPYLLTSFFFLGAFLFMRSWNKKHPQKNG